MNIMLEDFCTPIAQTLIEEFFKFLLGLLGK